MDLSSPVTQQSLAGGQLCLDFINTVDWRLRDPPTELLTSYADLVAWGRYVDALYGNVLPGREAKELLRVASRRPELARATLSEALALREALYRLFRTLARQTAPSPADLAVLNAALEHAMAHTRIAATDAGYAWDWERDEGALDRMLWPVVRSAADVLTAEDLSRLRECEGEGCGWLFYDASKNRSRRWCAMRGCGNRAKARRHYQRTRSATPEAEHLTHG
jgi:predicted RNA-binding Zn ribbon-like protein